MPTVQTGSQNLALLYQGVLTTIARMRVRPDSVGNISEFQKRITGVLDDVQQEALRLGYSEDDAENTKYAVVAFMDESALSSRDSRLAGNWPSLCARLFQNAIAGENFFHHVTALCRRRKSPRLADLLEVYYLCMLLGYVGKFAGKDPAGLRQLMDNIKSRIDAVRGEPLRLSPSVASAPPSVAAAKQVADPPARLLKIGFLAACITVGCIWMVVFIWLSSQASDIRSNMVS